MNKCLIISVFILLSSCTFMYQDFDKYGKNYNKVNLHLLKIGDDKQQVLSKIGKPHNVIGSKKFSQGLIEVWAYEKWYAKMWFDEKEEEYWLYFLNEKLEQWGRPGDWEEEADRIYEIRYR